MTLFTDATALTEISPDCVRLAPAVPLAALLREALSPEDSRYGSDDIQPTLATGLTEHLAVLRERLQPRREQRLRHLREQLQARLAPLTRQARALLERQLQCVQERIAPPDVLCLDEPAIALFAQYAYWSLAPEARSSASKLGTRKGITVDRCLCWPEGKTVSLIEPVKGRCPCPACGREGASFSTIMFSPANQDSRYELDCPACGHHESAARFGAERALRPFLACRCAACRQAQQRLCALARSRAPTLLESAARAASEHFAERQRQLKPPLSEGSPRYAAAVPLRATFESALRRGLPVGAAVRACLQWLQAPDCPLYLYQPDEGTVVTLLQHAGALRPEEPSGSAEVAPAAVEAAWAAVQGKNGIPSRAELQQMLAGDAPTAARALTLHELGDWDQALLACAWGVPYRLAAARPVAPPAGAVATAKPARRRASASEIEQLDEVLGPQAQRATVWLRQAQHLLQPPAAAPHARRAPAAQPKGFWFAALRLRGYVNACEAALAPQVALRGRPGAPELETFELAADAWAVGAQALLPEPEHAGAAELQWRCGAADRHGECALDSQRWENALLWALQQQRLYLQLGKDDRCTLLSPGPAVALTARWEQSRDGAWRLQVTLPDGLALPTGVGPVYVDMTRDCVGTLSGGWSSRAVQCLESMPPVPAAALPTFAQAWRRAGLAALIEPPPVPEVFVEDAPLLGAAARLHPRGYYDEPALALEFDYGPTGRQAPRVRREDGAIVITRRASPLEQTIRDTLSQAQQRAQAQAPHMNVGGGHSQLRQWLALQQQLRAPELAALPLRIDVSDAPYRLLGAGEVLVRLDDDPATLGVGIEVEGVYHPLDQVLRQLTGDPQFLDKLRSGDYRADELWYVGLPTGYVGVPLARLAAIMQHLWEIGARSGAASARRPVLLQWSLAALARAQGLRAVGGEAMQQRLRELLAPPPAALEMLPQALRDHLREGQAVALPWMHALARVGLGGLLADEMSVGKTLTALVFLWLEHQQFAAGRTSLVVAPKGAEDEWRREMATHGVHLSTVTLQGADPAAQLAGGPQVAFTTYEWLRRAARAYAAIEWHALITDESHEIRNHTTATTLALLGLNAHCRFALGGTPWNNSTMDLWAQYEFVVPGLLGDAKWFAKEIVEPMDAQGSQWHCDRLKRRIAPFTLRRTRKHLGLEDEGAARAVEVIKCVPCQRQRDLISSVMASARQEITEVIHAQGFKRSHTKIFEVIMRVRQAISHPQLLGIKSAADVPSVKFNVCKELIAKHDAAGDQLVVCTPFTSLLELLRQDSTADGKHVASITGAQSVGQRAAARDALDSGELSLLLLSMKAGGKVLNLQRANAYVQFDGWWNPFAELQARARVDRTGRQGRPMKLYELVVPDSIDDRMAKIKARKLAIADAIFGDAPIRPVQLTEDDVWELLAPMSAGPAA